MEAEAGSVQKDRRTGAVGTAFAQQAVSEEMHDQHINCYRLAAERHGVPGENKLRFGVWKEGRLRRAEPGIASCMIALLHINGGTGTGIGAARWGMLLVPTGKGNRAQDGKAHWAW